MQLQQLLLLLRVIYGLELVVFGCARVFVELSDDGVVFGLLRNYLDALRNTTAAAAVVKQLKLLLLLITRGTCFSQLS